MPLQGFCLLHQQVTCNRCGAVSFRYDTGPCVDLSVQDAATLPEALEQYTAGEHLCGCVARPVSGS